MFISEVELSECSVMGPGAQPRRNMVFPNDEHLILILIVVVVGAICV